ncbi:hypothetical protein [Aliikangiella maris]|uniref:Uncharacterized protein n=2 Tax=Aliikangiella maris TaxID=3162458 RepID=A0ABV2BUQ4_9GAMM
MRIFNTVRSVVIWGLMSTPLTAVASETNEKTGRARDFGIVTGHLTTGKFNAITILKAYKSQYNGNLPTGI